MLSRNEILDPPARWDVFEQPIADLALLFLEVDSGGWDSRNEVVEALFINYGEVDTARSTYYLADVVKLVDETELALVHNGRLDELAINPGLVRIPRIKILLEEPTGKLQREDLPSGRLEERREGFHQFVQKWSSCRFGWRINLSISRGIKMRRRDILDRTSGLRGGQAGHEFVQFIVVSPDTRLKCRQTLHSERVISQQGERGGLCNTQAQGFEIDS